MIPRAAHRGGAAGLAGSVALQELLGERELDPAPPPELRRRFLAALARDPGASQALRAALAAVR